MPEQHRPLHCPNCGAGEQHLEVVRDPLTRRLRFNACSYCEQPLPVEPEPAPNVTAA